MMPDPWWYLPLGARLLPVILLVPVAGGRQVPLTARLSLVIVLAGALAPAVLPAAPAPAGYRLVALLLRELGVGAVLALAAESVLVMLQMAGQLLDDSRGATQLRLPAAFTGDQGSALARLYLLLAMLVFFTAGGPETFLRALLHSYRAVPLAGSVPVDTLARVGHLALACLATAYRGACQVALPAVAALLLADCLLGFVNRTAPQIPVFFVGMPLKALLGVAAAALSLRGGVDAFLAAWPV